MKNQFVGEYNCIPKKEDWVEIKRTGIVPGGEYCTGCNFFQIELRPKINPWNDIVEGTDNIPRCGFFDIPLTEEHQACCCGNIGSVYKNVLNVIGKQVRTAYE